MDLSPIGAGIAALACIGAGLSIGNATAHAVDGIARQAEATAIYGFVIGIMIIML